jgi:formate/nitrite transporter FocA (FNT family)
VPSHVTGVSMISSNLNWVTIGNILQKGGAVFCAVRIREQPLGMSYVF